MPVLQDRVQETTTTGGTGTLTLAGAVTGYRSFAQAFSIGQETYYTIDNGSGEWEIGVGTVGSGTLSRDSVLESSNSNALVNFSAGTKRVFCSAPTKVLIPDQASNSGKVLTTNGTDPAWTTTLNDITLGNITPGSGAFTTLSASSTVSGTGFSTYLASPPAIGSTTPAAGAFTTLSSTGNTTLGDASGDTLTINAGTTTFAQGTANGVLYLNGSKVATSGTGLVFDGNSLAIGGIPISSYANYKTLAVGGGTNGGVLDFKNSANTITGQIVGDATGLTLDPQSGILVFKSQSVGEVGRVTAKGLLVGYTSDSSLSGTGNAIFSGKVGIGTSSPGAKLDVTGSVNASGGYLFGSSANYLYESTTQSVTFRIGTSPAYLSLLNSSGIPIVDGAGGVLAFATGSTERMRIDASGQCIWKPNGTTSAMTLDASGNLLVGVTGTPPDGNRIYLAEGNIGITRSSGAPQLNFYSSNVAIEFVNRNSGGAKTFYWYYAASGGGLPASLSSSGVWTDASDARGKENIIPIQYNLDTILSLNPRQYDVKSDGSHAVGFVAQEVLSIIPEVVHGSEEKGYGINYGAITAVLTKAIQELHAEIELLKTKVN